MKKEGLSIHCHHNILIEYCTDYEGRVEYIKSEKPEKEQEIRLRLFKILSRESMDDLPLRLRKVYAEWKKAYVEWQKAYAAEWRKAYAKWERAYAEWEKEDKNAWHRKWCGCKEWNGEEILFA